ncbi:MAG: imidazoleglycerol-phosphate dehydratase HisB [Clostridia bacterium]|nr:imidazoleglycerol-phosphate dehydratase HisB [Clostridia bacterium]
MRSASVSRKTAETSVALSLDLDGAGESSVQTGCGFLDHMLTLFAKHGRFDLTVSCEGDTEVDFHHTTEDIGIVLGQAFAEALGEKRGIRRYGDCVLPMDEALVLCAADLSGRGILGYDLTLSAQKVGDFDTELAKEFWLGFVRESGVTLHLRELSGENAHHVLEASFKAAGRALRQAVSIDPDFYDDIPSTKGILS